MIKTLSPHYIVVPLVNPDTLVVCGSYVLNIYVWDGNKSAVPSEPEYVMTKINAAASSGSDRINISHIVNDFIDFKLEHPEATSLENGNNQVWVKTEVYYDDEPEDAKQESILLATKGYGWFMEGNNPQLPGNKILLTGDEFKANRNGYFILPILINETP